MSQKNLIKTYCLSNGKHPNIINKILEVKLIDFGIDRARCHGGDLKGTSIVRLFQNADKKFKEFPNEINKSLGMRIKKLKLMNTLIIILKHELSLIPYSPR